MTTLTTQHLKTALILLSILLLAFLMVEPAFALNVEKIGKSLSGDDRAKMRVIKTISFYAGIFLIVLAGIVLALWKYKWAIQKRYDTSKGAAVFLVIVGILLMLPKIL